MHRKRSGKEVQMASTVCTSTFLDRETQRCKEVQRRQGCRKHGLQKTENSQILFKKLPQSTPEIRQICFRDPQDCPGVPQSCPRAPKSSPRASQEHPKSGQELPRVVPKLPKCAQKCPQSAQREPRSILRAHESSIRTVQKQSKSALRVKNAMCC